MKNGSLTQKQEIFTRNLFSGLSQSDAYREAGYAVAKQTLATIHSNASRLANNVKVLARLAQLNALIDDKAIMTKQERQERLSEIGREDIQGQYGPKRDPNISAIAELNKMGGDYAPERHAVLGDIVIEVIYVNRDKNQGQGRITDTA